MFKTKCPFCERKIERDFYFCPYCGREVKKQKEMEDYGFLGKSDDLKDLHEAMNLPFQGVINSLVQDLAKNFSENKPQNNFNGVKINISSSNGKIFDIKIDSARKENPERKVKKIALTEEQVKALSTLPREEAKTKILRLDNKIQYEIEIPGVNNVNNILINRLENSLEIKAISSGKIYTKILPAKTTPLNYKFSEGKLIFEFRA